jgi:signal peptidase I
VSSDDPKKVHWLRRVTIGRNPRVTLIRAVILGVLTVIAFKTTLYPVRVQGGSMLPNYNNGRINFIYRLAYRSHDPRRGDVVGVRFAGPSIMLLKRVVGLPGETISFSKGHVVVNGTPLPEPYLKWKSDWEREPVQLGPDEFFVVGDNRTMPISDHTFGIARRERILGKTLL